MRDLQKTHRNVTQNKNYAWIPKKETQERINLIFHAFCQINFKNSQAEQLVRTTVLKWEWHGGGPGIPALQEEQKRNGVAAEIVSTAGEVQEEVIRSRMSLLGTEKDLGFYSKHSEKFSECLRQRNHVIQLRTDLTAL